MRNCSLAALAAVTDNPGGGAPPPDIWEDDITLHYLRAHAHAPALDLPHTWPLHATDGMLAALGMLMPGDWSRAHAARLSRCVPGHPAFLQRPGQLHLMEHRCLTPASAEVMHLLAHVDLRGQGVALDPWCGAQGVASALRAHGLPVYTNDANPAHPADMHSDALQPSFYRALAARGLVGVVVSSPCSLVADLALPLAVHFAPIAVCMRLPGTYLTDAHPARLNWLRCMHAAGRLHVVMGLPKGPLGRRCIWLVVVASVALRRRLLGAAGPSALSL